MPSTTEEWSKIADDYWTKWNFPNCIGSLDGKHIAIRCPRNSGSLNFNYKHTFSVVLMALTDANYKFTYIDVGCKGRISDGGVYNRSSLHHAIENNQLNIPAPRCLPGSTVQTPFVILADDAFALKPYIMKPFNFRGQNHAEHVFNYRLSRGRRMVESTFGIMASRFRLLRTTIELSEENVKLCVLAICALHNWLMCIDENNENIGSSTYESNVPADDIPIASILNEQRTTNEAKEIRERLKSFFMNEGKVEWQNEMV